jgi:multidrug efflux pump
MRPIIMTSLTMALGALPIALSLGAAATSRIPLGIVLVGGIMFSLILTLYVIPSMYSYLSRKKKKSGMEILDEQESKRA